MIDYPDRMTDTVVRLVGRLGRPRRGPRLRILLVDRAPGGVTEQLTWWRKLNRDTDRLVQRSTRLSIQLEAGRLDLADRQRHATAAWTNFTDSTRVIPELDLTDEGYGNPLKLHMAVLLTARGEVHPDAESVVASFLGREERRWVDRLPRHSIADLTDLRAHQAVALATMTTPAQAVAVHLLTALPGMADPAGFAVERRTRITEWLAELFPGGDRIVPLTPDLLAEELLAKTPALDALVQGIHDHEACTTVHKARMLDALRLAVERKEVRKALRTLLVERLPALIEAAEQDSSLAQQIDTVIRSASTTTYAPHQPPHWGTGRIQPTETSRSCTAVLPTLPWRGKTLSRQTFDARTSSPIWSPTGQSSAWSPRPRRNGLGRTTSRLARHQTGWRRRPTTSAHASAKPGNGNAPTTG